ncbi:uncharacterized protein C11orf24 [Pimephales promelas]|uniref:uncharacterized protein C11orf24 n=1 Tax=Pimephales promelas TaxID=90988 RepID=UPI001955BD16|nr:uncharacterized protein C11orf24 [Pimephales promelas]
MIMTVHPVLVLVPIFGLLVLPCAPMHLKNGFKIVFNTTVGRPDDCDLKLCPEIESCSMALLNEDQSQLMCYLISCPNDTQNSSCGNVTKISELLAETESDNVDNNSTRELVPLQGSSGTNSSQSSPDDSSSNTTQPSASEANVSIFTTSTITKPTTLQNNLTTTVTNLLTNSTEKSATADAVPKPANSEAIPTPPAKTSTITTTPKPTTTSPKPSSATTSTTTTTTVAQTIIPKHPSSPSPSGTNSSVIISPLVPTSNSSSKPVQTSPIPTSSDGKPMRTTPKTSMSPSVVTSKLPKDIPKRDQAIVDVAGDSLTSHLLNTSSLLAVLFFGLLFFVVTVALFLKQAYESYKRKDYTQVDYLINGMYSDSGV